MSRSRMFGDDPLGEKDPASNNHDNVSPRRTIVGGRPPENRSELPPVPTGLQSLLRMASVDAEFCERLIQRRSEMADAAGVVLTTSERGMLQAVSEKQLRDMAQGLPAPAVDRRDFLRQSARAAVLVLGGAALSGCSQKNTKKETPPARKKVNEMQTEGGADPHTPPPRLEPKKDTEAQGGADDDDDDKDRVDAGTRPAPRPPVGDPTRGARADTPPPRTTRRNMTKRGGAAPGVPPKKKREP